MYSYKFRGLPLDCFLSWPHSLHKFIGEIEEGSCVIDVGCGEGSLIKAVNHYKGSRCVGVDLMKIEDSAGVTFFAIDVTKDKFPFEDNTINYILMNHVLEHLHRYDHTLKEIKRVLKPRGKLYIETPNTRTVLLPSLNYKIEQGMPINFYDDPSHIRPYSELALWHLLKHYFIPIEAGKSQNWFKRIVSPFMILKGFLKGDRKDIFLYLWLLTGGASYIICTKEE